MANYIWKPLYNYEASFFTQIGMFLGICMSVMGVGLGLVLSLMDDLSEAPGVIVLDILLIPGSLYILYLVYINSSSTVKRALKKYGIETYCKKNGLLLARTSSQKVGLFTTTGDLIVKPEYRNIVFMYHYYLLENQSGLWGAYNASLSKQVINCEYTSIKVEENLNIIVVKDGMRYTFSPYGSLIHKVNAATDDVVNKIMGRI